MRSRLLAIAFVLLNGSAAFAQVFAAGQWPGVTPPVFAAPSSGVTGAGVVTSPQLLLPDGTTALPGAAFAGEPSTGWSRPTTNWLVASVNAVARVGINATPNVTLGSGTGIGWMNTADAFSGSLDVILTRLAADVMAPAANDAYGLASKAWIRTAPTVTSAGTSPSVPASNGTAAFTVNVGTGGTATTIVMALPAATTGWACDVENLTATAANRADRKMVQQASTTTSVTAQYQVGTTGAATAMTASDIVRFICTGY